MFIVNGGLQGENQRRNFTANLITCIPKKMEAITEATKDARRAGST